MGKKEYPLKKQALTLFVTAECKNNCEHCSQQTTMCDHEHYQMGIKELKDVIDNTIDYFDYVRITGGEPTLWENLEDGIKLLLGAGFKQVMINTFKKKSVKNNDKVCAFTNRMKRGLEHTPLPKVKIPYSIFKDENNNYCHCARFFYLNGKIYFCSNIYNLSKKFGLPLEDFRSDLADNFIEKFKKYKHGKIEHCDYCHSNERVKRYFAKKEK